MHSLTHALGQELARAHQANHLAEARTRHAGRRAARRAVRPGRSLLPGRSVRLIGRPAV